jgi:flavin reductase (DIM6/NTAB) family NADH-FMN oxidoreductase RutF
MLAWLTTNDSQISLLDGYNAICYNPPTLMFASSAIPASFLSELKESKACSLSAVTARQPRESVTKATSGDREDPKIFAFSELDLVPAKLKEAYPSVVSNAPIHMYCTLHDMAKLTDNASMILLTVETFVIDGSALSPPTESMKTRSSVKAKIDADLIKPWVSLHGKVCLLAGLGDMPRPTQSEQGAWESAKVEPIPTSVNNPDEVYESVEWNFRVDGRECPLGYNPVTALIMPRPIGWISTYKKTGRVAHIAPYSFFSDVARGDRPMIAFSGHRPNDGVGRKDAQQDAEDMGCFGYNLVTSDLAVAMNFSAAPLKSEESEFELAGLSKEQAQTIDAPLVAQASIKMECEYRTTVDVPTSSFSIVVGEVKAIHINRESIVNGEVDCQKLRPITRLGYLNEYGLIQ